MKTRPPATLQFEPAELWRYIPLTDNQRELWRRRAAPLPAYIADRIIDQYLDRAVLVDIAPDDIPPERRLEIIRLYHHGPPWRRRIMIAPLTSYPTDRPAWEIANFVTRHKRTKTVRVSFDARIIKETQPPARQRVETEIALLYTIDPRRNRYLGKRERRRIAAWIASQAPPAPVVEVEHDYAGCRDFPNCSICAQRA